MNSTSLSKNYFIIWNTFLKYLPSRFFIILNSLIIIPFLAHILSSDEMSVFQISIGILNLICTCSSDWIAKSVLRFWVKYKKDNYLQKFYSNTLFISIFTYLLIGILFLFFSDLICAKFFIEKRILFLTFFLVIPCGIRQFLYQLLRIFNKPILYTFSIIVYQFSMLSLFILFSSKMENIQAILVAMVISMLLIDFYIISQLSLNIKIKLKIDSSIIIETLKYSLPIIVTSVATWGILNANKFILQYDKLFFDTAVVGIAWYLASNVLSPLLSTFLFAIFPTIIKKFENRYYIKFFFTNVIQLYFAIFLPIIAVFCLFSKEIATPFLSAKYYSAYILLPFFALSIFGHELMKLLNIKYHLRNKTYIEMIVNTLVGVLSLGLNIILIPKLNILAPGVVMLFSIILLVFFHSLIKFKSIDYILIRPIIKTFILTFLLIALSFSFVTLISNSLQWNFYAAFIKIVLFLIFYYIFGYLFKFKILE